MKSVDLTDQLGILGWWQGKEKTLHAKAELKEKSTEMQRCI